MEYSERDLLDAALLMRRILRHLPDGDQLKDQAIGWLKRKELTGSILRDEPQAVFNRPECPFHYCDQPAPYEACKEKCRHSCKG